MEGMEPTANMRVTLNNGIKMPSVGLGTFRIRECVSVVRAVDYALDAGYRLFDTAAVYNNEGYLKEAFSKLLPKYGLDRNDIFITTKLSPHDHGDFPTIQAAYNRSLDKLGMDFVDLFLIHFPGTSRLSATNPKNNKIRDATWAAMAELYDAGRVNAIGVSNFTTRHLDDLLQNNYGVIPAVNQIEWHPYYYQTDMLEFCNKNNIQLQAYCSLGGTSAAPAAVRSHPTGSYCSSTDSSLNDNLLADPVITNVAEKLNVTNAQVLFRWALQQNIAIIPKSTNQSRIRENISLGFDIPAEDMKHINSLGVRNKKYAWDPSQVA